MKCVFRSFICVVIGLVVEWSIIVIVSFDNYSENDGAKVLGEFAESVQVCLIIIIFALLMPIVLSLLKDFNSVVFLLKIPIEILLLIVTWGTPVSNDNPMSFYAIYTMIGMLVLMSVISFVISVIVLKIKTWLIGKKIKRVS